jgi:hypothetical protein
MAWLIVQHGYDCKELYDLADEAIEAVTPR